MIIALACDHGGLELKEEIKKHLEQIDIQVSDEGTYSLDSCNYAEFAIKAAKDVASKSFICCQNSFCIKPFSVRIIEAPTQR